MLEKLKNTLNDWATVGMKLPLAHDVSSGLGSITLMFVWISGFLTVGSLIALNFTDKTFTAAWASMAFWALAVVFYRLRRLDRFKLDLDDKSIELDGGGDEDKKDA